jgi:hypothetical protein
MNQRNRVWSVVASLILLGGGIVAGTAAAQKVDKSTNQKERSLVLGEQEVKQLLLLMDTDRSGKISRQEFMNFMAAEFDRLDTDKSGELDVKELAKSQIRVSHPTPPPVGK